MPTWRSPPSRPRSGSSYAALTSGSSSRPGRISRTRGSGSASGWPEVIRNVPGIWRPSRQGKDRLEVRPEESAVSFTWNSSPFNNKLVVFVNAIKKIAFQKQPIFLLNGEVMWQASDSPLSTKELHECYKTFLKVNLQSLHFPVIWNTIFQYILDKSSLLSIFVQRSMHQKKFVVNFLIFSIHFSKPFLSTFTIESAYKKLYEFVSFGFAVLTVILRLN